MTRISIHTSNINDFYSTLKSGASILESVFIVLFHSPFKIRFDKLLMCPHFTLLLERDQNYLDTD